MIIVKGQLYCQEEIDLGYLNLQSKELSSYSYPKGAIDSTAVAQKIVQNQA